MTRLRYEKRFSSSGEHQILTLGKGKLSWRMIECSIPHRHYSENICINGVLYYLAAVGGYGVDHGIVSFDIKSEKFNFIQAANARALKLVNYKCKLATLKSDEYSKRIYGTSTSLVLSVLEDAEKHKWSNHTYVLPPLWKDLVGDAELSFVGVTRTGEIVMSPDDIAHVFYLIYYNLERNTITKVEIQGIDTSKYSKVHTFLDHVEDVKLWSSV